MGSFIGLRWVKVCLLRNLIFLWVCFGYSTKVHMILMIATVVAIDQTCFSDAIVFLWRVLFELFKQAFSVGDVYPYPTPPTWEKQIKKREWLISFKLGINLMCSRLTNVVCLKVFRDFVRKVMILIRFGVLKKIIMKKNVSIC